MYKIKLSPHAKIFYTEWLLNPSNAQYNLLIDQTLYGPLDKERLRKACTKYVSEHLLLNSHIQDINGNPYWVKNDTISELEYTDSPTNKSDLLNYVAKNFDLYSGPLYRFKLLRIDDNVHRFLVILHHTIMDGPSVNVGILKNISDYYNDENHSTKYNINQQIKLITDLEKNISAKIEKNKDKNKEFWRKQLYDTEKADLSFLKLTSNQNKTEIPANYNPISTMRFVFGKEISNKLKQLKQKHIITPYIFGQCVFAILLHRLSNQNNITISFPIAIKEGMDFIYGGQINSNIANYYFDDATTAIDIIKQSRDFFRSLKKDNHNHSYYPITNIAQKNNKNLLELSFIQTNLREDTYNFNGINKAETSMDINVDSVSGNMLQFEQEIKQDNINHRVRFNKMVYSEKMLKEFIGFYEKLLLNILDDLLNDNINKPVSCYNFLDTKQYQQLVYKWNKTEQDYPHNKTTHELFEQQVLKTPDNIATIYEDKKLTYKELNNKTNRLANYLRHNHDIKPDDLIALCLDSNEDMVTVMLGILKSGGAYAPINSNYPDERIGYILNDTKAKTVLTNHTLKEKLQRIVKQKKLNISIIVLDSKKVQNELAEQKKTNPVTPTKSNNLIYVLYTSGTSGNPKGVMVEHKGVVSLVKHFDYINADDSFIQFCDISFDVAYFEIWTPLLNGSKLVIPKNKMETLSNVDLFYEKLTTNKITTLWLTKTIFDQLFVLNESIFKNIKHLLVGGEALNKILTERLINSDQKPKNIINGYGPTENTIFSTTLNITKKNLANTETVPIGIPLANRKTYVLDKNLNPLPIGAFGELHLSGPGLARGYLNKPEITVQKFINNPFQTSKEKLKNINSKLYKTGDLARWLPDGNLEFLGRNDDQIKIRGFRIELEEIENKLLNYPQIKQTAVTVEQEKNNRYLVAYYVADNKLDQSKLHNYLISKLPDYMVPNIFVYIQEFPVTKNGKLDKKALQKPNLAKQSKYAPPKNRLEKSICKLYAQILNIPIQNVGIKNDFFEMGGDSISAIQLTSRIRQQLELNVSIQDVFNQRNVEQLAANILNSQNKQTNNKKEIKSEDNPMGQAELLPIQKWFFENVKHKSHLGYNHWNQSFIIKTPELNIKTLKSSIKKLLEHHDAFRLRYKNFQQHYIDIDFDKEAENIKVIDVSSITPTELEKKLANIQKKLNIENGPIYTIAYLHNHKDKTARLFFTLHHLIVDSISWQILTHSISKLYQLLQNKNNINKTSQELLGQKGTSYRQWTEEIKNYKPIQKEINYWDDVLKNYTRTQEKGKNKTKENYEEFSLTPQATQKLLTQSNKTYNTQINDLLLSALARTISQTLNTQTNYITLEGHGREEINKEIDITKTLGWFTTMYPVKLINHPNISELIKTTKENLRNIPNKGIGYGTIKGYKNLPLIRFNYLGQINNSGNLWNIIDEGILLTIKSQNGSENLQNDNVLDIYGYTSNGMLKFHISHQNNTQLTVKEFADKFKSNLEAIAGHCSDKSRSYLTTSDINKIIDQKYLDNIQKNAEVENVYLANNLQQGLLYHTIRYDKTDDAYLSQYTWEYNSPINRNKLKKAWKLMQKKYPGLRMRFAWDSEIVQIIDKDQKLYFKYIDLKTLQKKKTLTNKQQIEEILEKDRRKNYDLQHGQLIRIYLIKLSEDNYLCICSAHHIILDGWSFITLFNNVHETYSQLLKNKQPQIIESIIYKKAQQYLQEHKNEDKEYWDNHIKQIENRTELTSLLKPSARNIEIKNHMQIKHRQKQDIKIKGETLTKLKNLCQKNAITLNAIVQYTWHKILYVYGASDTTITGTIVSGRNTPVDNIENAVGLFINTVPLVYKHSKDLNIIEQIKNIQNLINEINDKNNVELFSLQSEGERLFDSLISYENYPSPKSNISNIKHESIQETIRVDYPLLISAYERKQALTIIIRYAGELFSKETIVQLLHKILFFVEQIIENPAKETLNYLDQEEYKRLVIDYNKTEQDYPHDKTIHKLFEEQALKTPHNIAIAYEDKKLTYEELNNNTNRLANYLRCKFNIKPDDLITLYLNGNEYLMETMIGILKSGGAYVPISPNYPNERVSYILNDTKTKLIITDNVLEKRLQQIVKQKNLKTNIITIDNKKTQVQLTKQKETNPDTLTTSNNLIYVTYTSGTSGNPKGVMIEHGSVASTIKNVDYIDVDANDSFIHFCDTGFDFSIFEIWTPLLHGAKLVIPKNKLEVLGDINLFRKKLTTNKITTLLLTKTIFDQLFLSDKKVFKNLKYLLIGGEALNKTLTDKLVNSKYKPENVINAYGPTENTVLCCTLNITPKNIANINTVPIGKSLTNRKSYVLNKRLNPLPTGAIGELYVSGTGMARGYLNKPELTAENFIDNPFQTSEEKLKNINNKLYKTGDLVRWLPDGNLEFLGRNDGQIKIRGFRVELEEIENKLLHYPQIKQTATILRKEKNNEYLTAYYVSIKKIDQSILQEYLASQLPDYMIPSIFIHLKKLPVTKSGKLDKKALPLPIFKNKYDCIQPRNTQEQLICEIFSKVLNIPNIGINDNFFSLGGNSILAIKLVFMLQKNFDVKLSDVFELRTPKKIAEHSSFGKNFLRHRLKQVKLEYNKKQDPDKSIEAKIQQEQDAYLKSIKNIHTNISLKKPISNILLTGSTGYLGCNILNELLKLTNYKIYLLIRAKSQSEAIERINEKYQFYFNKDLSDVMAKRVQVIKADIEQDHLGIPQSKYQNLATKIDSIINAAALVKHYGEYDKFYSANVKATTNLLEFTKLTKLKDFHHVSTISVLNSIPREDGKQHIYTENTDPPTIKCLNNVYTDTKSQSEHQTIKYREFGLNCNIYRVGNLAFMAKNRRSQENIEDNAFYHWLKCLFAMKRSTDIINTVEISPTDLVAQAIVKIFDKKYLSNQTHHVFNPYLFNITNILKKKDFEISMIDTFINHIMQYTKKGLHHNLILRFLLHQGWLDQQNIDHKKILQDKTRCILKKLDFDWEPITDEMLHDYCNNLNLT